MLSRRNGGRPRQRAGIRGRRFSADDRQPKLCFVDFASSDRGARLSAVGPIRLCLSRIIHARRAGPGAYPLSFDSVQRYKLIVAAVALSAVTVTMASPLRCVAALVAESLYFPGGTLSKTNEPSALVVALPRTIPRSSCRARGRAACGSAPSITLPSILPGRMAS